MKQKGWLASVLIFLSLFFLACDQIKAVKDTFFGEEKKEAVSEKKKPAEEIPAPEKISEAKAEEEMPAEEKPTAEEPTAAEPKEEKSAEANPPKTGEVKIPEGEPVQDQAPAPIGPTGPMGPIGAPTATTPPSIPISLVPTDHFGGAPTMVQADERFVIVGFGRKLNVYDHSLNSAGFVNLEAKALGVFSKMTDHGGTIYVQEERNVLEVVSISPGNGAPKVLKTFEVEGPFDVQAAMSRVFVYLTDKVQVLDLNDLSQVQVVSEIPLGGVLQMISQGGYYYAVHGTTITVIENQTLSILASIPLGAKFKILGSRTEGETTFLILTLQSLHTGQWQTIQIMPLVKGGGGIADLGKGIELKLPAETITADQNQAYLYLLRGGNLSLFDLGQKEELEGPAAPVQNIRYVTGAAGAVFAASDRELGRFDLQIQAPPPAAVTQPPESKQEDKGSTPLAVPAKAKKEPRYKWANEKIFSIPGKVEALLLMGKDSVLLVNALATENGLLPPLYYSTTFSTDTSKWAPIKHPKNQKVHFGLLKMIDSNVLAFDTLSGKMFLVKSDLSSLSELNLAAPNIVGMDAASDGGKAVPGGGKTNYLYLTTAKKDGKGETSLMAYSLASMSLPKKLGSLSLNEIGGVSLYSGSNRALVACGLAGVCIVDVGTARNKMAQLVTIPSSQKEARALDVKVAPDEKTGFVFYEKSGEFFVSIVDLTAAAPAELSVIPNLKVTQEQFRGITFAAGGRWLLVPDDEGLAVYYIKNPKKPVFAFRWPVGKASFADVTNRGKTVCVALGEKGVECGSF